MALVDVPLLLIHKRTPVIQSCTFLVVFFQVAFLSLFLIFLYQLGSNNKVQMMHFHCFFSLNQFHYFISLYMLLSYVFHYDVHPEHSRLSSGFLC